MNTVHTEGHTNGFEYINRQETSFVISEKKIKTTV